jgi:hypothetical protein
VLAVGAVTTAEVVVVGSGAVLVAVPVPSPSGVSGCDGWQPDTTLTVVTKESAMRRFERAIDGKTRAPRPSRPPAPDVERDRIEWLDAGVRLVSAGTELDPPAPFELVRRERLRLQVDEPVIRNAYPGASSRADRGGASSATEFRTSSPEGDRWVSRRRRARSSFLHSRLGASAHTPHVAMPAPRQVSQLISPAIAGADSRTRRVHRGDRRRAAPSIGRRACVALDDAPPSHAG